MVRLKPGDAEALADRCRDRAIVGRLPEAVAECTESLRLTPRNAKALDSRGLAYLKMRRLDLAITDYDAALKLSPELASALYGRGEAKRIKGDAAGADRDVLAAKRIDPGISDDFARFGARDF